MNAPAPAFAPVALTPATREKIERAVEQLLALLDGADDEPDLESDTDAEAGSWAESEDARNYDATPRLFDEHLEQDADIEPWLGWSMQVQQFGGDYHANDDDRESDDSEREPSLGFPEAVDQSEWSRHPGTEPDLEEQHDREREECW